MSPTSYQAAPPRTTTIADEHSPVKSGNAHAQNSCNILGKGAGNCYHSLYGVLSRSETRVELECTSTMPVLD